MSNLNSYSSGYPSGQRRGPNDPRVPPSGRSGGNDGPRYPSSPGDSRPSPIGTFRPPPSYDDFCRDMYCGFPIGDELEYDEGPEYSIFYMDAWVMPDPLLTEWRSEPLPPQQPEMAGEEEKEPAKVAFFLRNGILSAIGGVTGSRVTSYPLMTSVRMGDQYPDGPANSGITPELDEAMSKSRDKLTAMGRYEEQKAGAEDLVVRARAGEQNAMALIELIRLNAQTSDRARLSMKLMHEYIKEHPVNGESTFSADYSFNPNTREMRNRGCVQMANGSPLDNQYVGNMVQVFGAKGSQKRKIIALGIAKYAQNRELNEYAKKLSPPDAALLEYGRCIGFARAIQLTRRAGSAISAMSRAAGWEMGE